MRVVLACSISDVGPRLFETTEGKRFSSSYLYVILK